ncbi:MAG: hypothetical protein KJN92_14360, partial [Gemmatimonadetes bacterium]|nr:hypothetical protein [Gemmatimonadota bacterium]
LGGYLRSLTQVSDPGYRIPGSEDRTSWIHADVVRLKWTLRFGESVLVEVHNRLQVQVSSTELEASESTVGFGVSVVPGRRWDLSSEWVDEDRLKVWHDIDRLSLTWYSGVADVTVGRQAITWGISNVYPVSDLWAQFSPFELDTEEKPGIDAVRILSYPSGGLELDAVVADRGSSRNLSAGVRMSLSLPWADLYAGGGKLWREAMGLVGISAPLGVFKLRAEGVLPYDLDVDEYKLPRATLGIDRLGGSTTLSVEYNFNGIGATNAEAYGEVLDDPRFAQGETYFLGRHNLGALAAWTPGNDRLSLSLTGLLNLHDPSSALVPNLTYDLGQATRLALGALVSFGDKPLFLPQPTLRSEFGTYGDFMYAMASVYF